MVTTVNPNAIATPTNPIPSSGYAAASTALPHPPSTSQSVPINSATSFFIGFFVLVMEYKIQFIPQNELLLYEL
jgi:hypothetical protein